MNDLRILLRKGNDNYFIAYNYTKNIIERVNIFDTKYMLNLDSIYRIDNISDMINKNNYYSILSSYSKLYKKAIDYIVINYLVTDNEELSQILIELNKSINYFLIFKVDYDDFIDVFKTKLTKVMKNKKLVKGI